MHSNKWALSETGSSPAEKESLPCINQYSNIDVWGLYSSIDCHVCYRCHRQWLHLPWKGSYRFLLCHALLRFYDVWYPWGLFVVVLYHLDGSLIVVKICLGTTCLHGPNTLICQKLIIRQVFMVALKLFCRKKEIATFVVYFIFMHSMYATCMLQQIWNQDTQKYAKVARVHYFCTIVLWTPYVPVSIA